MTDILSAQSMDLPGSELDVAKMPGHWLLARLGKRVLRPGGRLLVLEFSKVAAPLAKAYDWYSFNVLPRLGQWIAGDAASYRYLAESIRMHPDQETLKGMMTSAGLSQVRYFNLTGGVVALHEGLKI